MHAVAVKAVFRFSFGVAWGEELWKRKSELFYFLNDASVPLQNMRKSAVCGNSK